MIKYAYFQCIHQGFYHIINYIPALNAQRKSSQYVKLYFPLALSGDSDIKNVKQYLDYDNDLTYDIVEKLNIYDRYHQVLS